MQHNNNLVAILKNVAELIFSNTHAYVELKDVLSKWKESLELHHKLDMNSPEYNENVYLEEGKAIATRWAALCIEDLIRTKRFVRAVRKAVDAVLHKQAGKPATIMYVGTGPFATLVLPLTQIFSPSELQLDLIEVNTESFKLLNSTIDSYGIRDFIRNCYCADATQFRVDNDDVDILLVECLQQALAREPQVKIVENLVPQLKGDLILIPEDITLSLALVNTKQQQSFMHNLDSEKVIEFYEIIDTVFSINKEVIQKNSIQFNSQTNLFDEEQLREYNRISIFTEMRLYEDEILTYNESGLTIPWDVNDFTSKAPVYGVTTNYVTGNDPKLDIKLIRTRETGPDQ
jgi:hypothetical protein